MWIKHGFPSTSPTPNQGQQHKSSIDGKIILMPSGTDPLVTSCMQTVGIVWTSHQLNHVNIPAVDSDYVVYMILKIKKY